MVDARIVFTADGLVLHQNGAEMPAKRVTILPPAPKEIQLSAEALKAFVGRYQLTPEITLAVTREGTQLSAQATGQPSAPIFPTGPKDFFYNVVDAQITFTADGLVLHQNGADLPAKRIKE